MRIFFLLLVTFISCNRQEAQFTIKHEGSDTMLGLAEAWAKEYKKVNPKVAVEVSGGGTEAGITGLINGTVDVANASRAMTFEEKASFLKNNGKAIKEHIVGLDALAVFVNPANSLKSLTQEELACIYGEFGTCLTWTDVRGTVVPGCKDNKIIRVSRPTNTGTYHHFKEAVVGTNKDLKQVSVELNRSREVVEQVEKNPCAIGYSGMGSLTSKVSAVCIEEEGKCFSPSVETASGKTYPITRKLYMYTSSEPPAEVRGYINWATSEYAKKFVFESGYVPL